MTDMGASEKFCLKWNDFETNISMAFRELREDKDFFDITLVCDNEEQVEAHKVVLSACSPFFRSLLRRNRHQHPLLFLRGVSLQELLAVLTFMYHGEVNVAQEELNSFLALAEELQVKGLTQGSQGAGAKRGVKRPPAQKDERSSKKSWNPAPQPALPVPALVEDEVEEVEEVVMVKSETPVNGTSALVEAESEEFAESYGEYDSFQYTTDSGQLGGAEGQDKDEYLDSLISSKMRRVVDAVGQSVWECTECGKSWAKRSKTARHVETHIGGTQLHCPHCDSTVKNRPSLQCHMYNAHRSLMPGLELGLAGLNNYQL